MPVGLAGEDDIVQSDGRPLAHAVEDAVGLQVEIFGCVKFGNRACVHDADPVVANDSPESICRERYVSNEP